MTASTGTPATLPAGGTGTTPLVLDALIMGAGIGGLYQLHQLRKQGLRVRAYEAGSGVGGTWYWNRYPGARTDSEGMVYQYLFSRELYTEWNVGQRFPDQPEIERWLNWVAERLDLKTDIQFNTRVTGARFDEARGRWIVHTDRGDVIDTQFFLSCAGPLSAPLDRVFEGQEDFRGTLVHTSRWPAAGVDLAGKRVGVIGVGATGIQVVQTIAPEVAHLSVFVRTPQYVLPMTNPVYGPEEQAAYKARFDEFRATNANTFTGFQFDLAAWTDFTAEQREALLEDYYADGSLKLWLAGFVEAFFDPQVNDFVSEFIRGKMRERLKGDPHLCDVLIPVDYGFGSHRVPLETGYLETYHRDNVEAVGVRDNPIARILPHGLELTDGTVHELDVLILATGFDAVTGALTRVDIRGRDGRSLAEEWNRDIRTLMGLAVHGYPNLLMTTGPLSPAAALCNMPTCLQQQTEWISGLIGSMREQGKSLIEATEDGQNAWVAHCDELAAPLLLTKEASWWTGGNVSGKPTRLLPYAGGVGAYKQRCDDEANRGYPSFRLS